MRASKAVALRAPVDRGAIAHTRTVAPVPDPPPREWWFCLVDVSKSWPTMPAPVLDSVELALPRGSLTWIGGSNGVGKTTLLRIAAGLIAPDSGFVSFDGLDPVQDRSSFQRRTGFLSAGNGGLYARLSVRRHLDYGARIAFVPAPQREAIIEDTLRRFGLEELAGRRVDRLSTGQRQRVRLALTFLHDPDLVFLDEPRSSLDEAGVAMLQGTIGEFVAGGGTVVWCAPTGEDTGLEVDFNYRLDQGRLLEA